MSTTSEPLHGNTSTTDQKFTFTQGEELGITVTQNRPSFGVTRVTSQEFTVQCQDVGSLILVDTAAAGGDVDIIFQNDYPDPNGRKKRFGVQVVVEDTTNVTNFIAETEDTDEDAPSVSVVGQGTSVAAAADAYSEVEVEHLGETPDGSVKEVLLTGDLS